MITPSCNALIVHDDDDFRKKLIATMDQEHFAVTFAADGPAALEIMKKRRFSVVMVGLNLVTKKGTATLEYLREHKANVGCGVLIVGDSNPSLRTAAPWADETLVKPVDAAYVAARARAYCRC